MLSDPHQVVWLALNLDDYIASGMEKMNFIGLVQDWSISFANSPEIL